jgi:hypothetical protein
MHQRIRREYGGHASAFALRASADKSLCPHTGISPFSRHSSQYLYRSHPISENAMKLPFAAMAASLVCLIVAPVFAQTTPAPTATVPVPATKRVTCLGATQNLKGQDKRDQMQLCMAQARLDCLKQAIDQKLVGEARKSAIKTCVGADGPEQQEPPG